MLAKNKKIDILIVNETKIDDKVEDQLIAINFKPKEDFPNKSLELVCIEVEPKNSLPFIILGWYRPPNSPVSCFECLEENLRYFDGENKEMILLGVPIVTLVIFLPQMLI